MTDKELYQELMRRMNGPARAFELAFIAEFENEHPTLQQALVRHMIVPALNVLKAHHPDARNQAATDFAWHALETANPNGLYFPTI